MKKLKLLLLSFSLFFCGILIDTKRKRLSRMEDKLPLSHPRLVRSAKSLEKSLTAWQKKEQKWTDLHRILQKNPAKSK